MIADDDGLGGERGAGVSVGGFANAVDPELKLVGGTVAADGDDLILTGRDGGGGDGAAEACVVVVSFLEGEAASVGLE